MPDHSGCSGVGCAVSCRGDVDVLDERLGMLADLGYDSAELNPQEWDVIHRGRLVEEAAERWVRVAERHRRRLQFSVHAPVTLNLFERREPELALGLLVSSIEIARRVDAETVVVHPGFRGGGDWQNDQPMESLLERERNVIGEALACFSGPMPMLVLETMLPPRTDNYSYGAWPDQLAAQVRKIDHPGVGVCLDTGHLYIAAHWFGFDYLDAVNRLAPLITHIHLQDSFGVHDAHTPDTPSLGHGDVHLPVGWGTAPLGDVFSTVDFPRRPMLLAEMKAERHIPYAASVLDRCRKLAGLARAHR